MNKLLLIIVFLISIFIHSQELKYVEVVSVDPNITKDELYNRARSWIGRNFNRKKSSVDIEDKAAGELVASGTIDYRKRKSYYGASCVEGPVKLTLSIFVKDGRYKYVFHSFVHQGSKGFSCKNTDYGLITTAEKAPQPSWGNPKDIAWEDIKEFIKDSVELNVSDLKQEMNKPSDTDNNW
ncbi:DUF4468 domain-containing protein [Chryseobacterium sp. Mn2064]|uniref:DUF4468 domain-containing protein n=1 Tax=Chryseobacterium sp. Mn2064 TaxID=3395263 RepID=UPI003BC53D49